VQGIYQAVVAKLYFHEDSVKMPLQFVKHAVEEIADGCKYAELPFLVATTRQWMLITPRGFPSTPKPSNCATLEC
jgi:hypothetical protein